MHQKVVKLQIQILYRGDYEKKGPEAKDDTDAAVQAVVLLKIVRQQF
jgi:hypothetical protein